MTKLAMIIASSFVVAVTTHDFVKKVTNFAKLEKMIQTHHY